MKYIVQYTLPYEHQVMVGIEAENRDKAIIKANRLFDQGDIWDDTAEVPLLYDDYVETGDAGVPLTFTIEDEVSGDWPEADASVKAIRRRDAAFLAAKLLVEAYQHGEERGESIDWAELDQAYQVALQATGSIQSDSTRPSRSCERLAIVVEGGNIQAVIADHPDVAPSVAVIDYDTDGFGPEELSDITQSDGSLSTAVVSHYYVEDTVINLDEVFQVLE